MKTFNNNVHPDDVDVIMGVKPPKTAPYQGLKSEIDRHCFKYAHKLNKEHPERVNTQSLKEKILISNGYAIKHTKNPFIFKKTNKEKEQLRVLRKTVKLTNEK
jgi:hypothetical protein